MNKNLKALVKTVSTNFPNYKFSICRNSYSCDLIVKIKPVDKTETFAYYGGDSIGYVVDNENYYSIGNKFQSEFRPNNVRVMGFIENSKTMLLEFKQL
jgi:hypothetical protein